ncbi:MAG: single-stranded-DNA-specific exonuclease RecJ, partial [Epsilonproteobacteria bacterium]|nr:single-stranded-DNA-specific exonuclease RecJ [Campylobacterota bacterium]
METLTKQRIFELLYARHSEFLTLKDLPHPYSFKDMQKGVKRIVEAIKNREKIALIGDYDVDGVVATTIIRELFEKINYPLEWIIPNRFRDGYGITKEVIDRVDADLIITVDNGIVAFEAAEVCKERGIDLIITDHHSLDKDKRLPVATAIINQKQHDCGFKYKEICGAQIAWYLAIAIAKELGVEFRAKELLDLVALAIVADIMPLTHINRAMLIAGLQQIKKSNRAFIKALEREFNFKDISSETIGYYLGPLINSAGRLKDASIASEFLFTKDIERALNILEELKGFNSQRKRLEREILKEAIKQVKRDDKIAIVWGSSWNEGVVGIVAARVANYFKMPAVVLSCKDGICKGSGRSYGDCDLFKLTTKAKELYLRFGGHKMAVGLSFKEENLPLIKSILKLEAKECNRKYIDRDILGELNFNQIDIELVEILEKFEPYGEGNPKPKFIAKNIEVLDIKEIGENKEHKRYMLRQQNRVFKGLEFRSKSEDIKRGDIVEITFTISKNIYNGQLYIDLFLEE